MYEPAIYQIWLKGSFHAPWYIFDSIVTSHRAENKTLITTPPIDLNTLHTILTMVDDINLKLLSVYRIATNSALQQCACAC